MIRRPPRSTLFPTRRSSDLRPLLQPVWHGVQRAPGGRGAAVHQRRRAGGARPRDRKSTRLNSSHVEISYAVFCLKKKKTHSNLSLESQPTINTITPAHTTRR